MWSKARHSIGLLPLLTLWACASPLDPAPIDRDGDGFSFLQDCDDGDATRHPGAVEECNFRDDDCDWAADERGPDDRDPCVFLVYQ